MRKPLPAKSGRLTLIEQGSEKSLFRCDCGTEKEILNSSVRRKIGATKSCGCLQREKATQRGVERFTTHGEAKTKENATYHRIKRRCENENDKDYSRYGGRGIKCRFADYEEFIAEVGKAPSPSHSIERIDNDGHYESGNVRWATKKEQANNRRSSRRIAFNGRTLTLQQWADETGINRQTISERLRTGFTAGQALGFEKTERRRV